MLVVKNDNLNPSIQGEDPNFRAEIIWVNVILIHCRPHQEFLEPCLISENIQWPWYSLPIHKHRRDILQQ